METNSKLSALETIREYARIRRGEHPGWTGDPVLNGESFAHRIGARGRAAYDMCAETDDYEVVDRLSDETGLPPNAIRRFVGECRKAACVQVYYENSPRGGHGQPPPQPR